MDNQEVLFLAYLTLGVTISASIVSLVSTIFTYYFMNVSARKDIKSLLRPLESLDLRLAERSVPDAFIAKLANRIKMPVEDIDKERWEISRKWKGEVTLDYEFALIMPKSDEKIQKPKNIFLMASADDPDYQTFAYVPEPFTASKPGSKVKITQGNAPVNPKLLSNLSRKPGNVPFTPTRPASKLPFSDLARNQRIQMAKTTDPNYKTMAMVPNAFESIKKGSQPLKTPATLSALNEDDAYENLQDDLKK